MMVIDIVLLYLSINNSNLSPLGGCYVAAGLHEKISGGLPNYDAVQQSSRILVAGSKEFFIGLPWMQRSRIPATVDNHHINVGANSNTTCTVITKG